MRVLAAMSGGVDSAVAAARAVDAGHDVVGVHMALSRSRAQHRTGSRGCCSIEDASDARRAADVIGVLYYVWDLSERFEETVVADFLAEYAAGRTPNPCVRCNEHVKFAALLDRALALGFDAVCTGHYARVEVVEEPGGSVRRELHRAAAIEKDQSYVLAVMGRQRLARCLFPLGDAPSKESVRAEAAARGLSVSAKADSYDICFVADGDTQGFLRGRLGSAPGPVVDVDGTVLGEHEGAHLFTVGQRRGLRLGRPAPDGRPRYVLAVEPVSRTVRVGPREALEVADLEGEDVVWLADDVPADEWLPAEVQLRAHGSPVLAEVRLEQPSVPVLPSAPGNADGADAPPPPAARLVARLREPARAVAPGQSVVVYAGTRVLGQATLMAG
jgi:tRNA-specific 2-thiouridylase